MNSGTKPAAALAAALRELFEKSQGVRYGLNPEGFEVILEQVAAKYAPGAGTPQKIQLWRELRLEELALARGCACGHEYAWQEFLTRYREKLYDIARGITKEDSSARELARSEEHTSELQSLTNLVCRLLLEKKK